jgi:hypothetical protein
MEDDVTNCEETELLQALLQSMLSKNYEFFWRFQAIIKFWFSKLYKEGFKQK